jgi:hypothetical protein
MFGFVDCLLTSAWIWPAVLLVGLLAAFILLRWLGHAFVVPLLSLVALIAILRRPGGTGEEKKSGWRECLVMGLCVFCGACEIYPVLEIGIVAIGVLAWLCV